MRRALAAVLFTLLPCGAAPAIVGQADEAVPLFVRHTLKVIIPKGACSAVVVGPQLAMTAAHCVVGASSVKIAGTQTGLIEAVKVVSHPHFANRANDAADIAVLKTAKVLPGTVLPAMLGARPVRPGETLIAVGYGLQDGGKRDGSARMAALAVAQIFANSFTLADPVALGERPKRGACGGDSGAPVFSSQGGSLFLVGIISGSDNCGGTTLVISLAPYRNWIEQTSRQLDAQLGP